MQILRFLVGFVAADSFATSFKYGSVHINSGHFQDPPHRPGLAHFHEHMLFLGTAKYPGENDFEQYLGRNGGSSNAFTDMVRMDVLLRWFALC